MTDLVLTHFAHAVITVLIFADLGLHVHWMLAHRKTNGAGNMSSDYWIRVIDKLMEDRIAPLEKEIQELRQTIVALTGR